MDAVAQLEHGLGVRQSARLSAMTYSSVDVRAEIETLFSRHHAEIYAYLARMVREPELAADLAQDTFVKAYRAFDSLEDPAHARAWLYQIAHRVALDEFRRRKIVRFLPWTGESRGAAPSAEHLALEGRFSGDMERALRKIPERQRSALLLAELHDLTGLELAAALGVSHVAARALLTRARESLRQALAAERAADEGAERAADAPGAVGPTTRRPGDPGGGTAITSSRQPSDADRPRGRGRL
jgi:RNA polymerase sigma-70 factor (ECF subfamily)